MTVHSLRLSSIHSSKTKITFSFLYYRQKRNTGRKDRQAKMTDRQKERTDGQTQISDRQTQKKDRLRYKTDRRDIHKRHIEILTEKKNLQRY